MDGEVQGNEGIDIVPVEVEGSDSAANNDVGIEDADDEVAELPVDDTDAHADEQVAEEEPAREGAQTVEAAADETDELVVSEWPDPKDPKAIATLDTHGDDDRDASAGGG